MLCCLPMVMVGMIKLLMSSVFTIELKREGGQIDHSLCKPQCRPADKHILLCICIKSKAQGQSRNDFPIQRYHNDTKHVSFLCHHPSQESMLHSTGDQWKNPGNGYKRNAFDVTVSEPGSSLFFYIISHGSDLALGMTVLFCLFHNFGPNINAAATIY